MKTMKTYKMWLFLMIFTIMSVSAFADLDDVSFEIISPTNKIYNETNISLEIIANTTLDNITYQINDEDLVLACESCNLVNETIELVEGDYTILAYGYLNEESIDDSVDFTIDLSGDYINEDQAVDFTIEILSPEDETYNTTEIELTIESNETLDNISYSLNSANYVILCEDCSYVNEEIIAQEGDNEIIVLGILQGIEKEQTIEFEVELADNADDDNADDNQESRFTQGLNKLPQMLANGELTDEELAEIIRSNLLNPGIINRLIKTGMLGDESIDAIIDTQSTPPGIFKKIFAFFGFGKPTFAESIYHEYNISAKTKQKILEKDLLPKKEMNEIKKEMKANFQGKIVKNNNNNMNNYEVSENDDEEGDNEADENNEENKNRNQNALENQAKNEEKKVTKQPPGLEKKSQKIYNAGKQNGNTKFNQQDEIEILEKSNNGKGNINKNDKGKK